MTTLVQQPSRIANPLVGVAFAVSLLGGLAGGAVAVAVPAVIEAREAAERAEAAYREKWLKYGREWEARYRQMYPIIELRSE
jgi:hypothetical protein